MTSKASPSEEGKDFPRNSPRYALRALVTDTIWMCRGTHTVVYFDRLKNLFTRAINTALTSLHRTFKQHRILQQFPESYRNFQSTHLENEMVRQESTTRLTDQSPADTISKPSSCKSPWEKLCLLSIVFFGSLWILYFSLATEYLSTSNVQQVALTDGFIDQASPCSSPQSFKEILFRDLLLCSCYFP